MQAEGLALVTGASRGIGKAIALDLASAGFEVIATMRNPDDGADLPGLAAAQGGTLRVERLDVTEPDSIRIPNGLRVLVNNAGVEGEYLPVEHMPLDQWRTMLETNVIGVVNTLQKALPRMRAAGGVICNVSSSSYLAAVPFYAAYRASKAAVGAISESLRAEVLQFGIRVVEILPGPVVSDMLMSSERMPEAARHEEYRELAQRSYQQREAVSAMYQPVDKAALLIREAILNDEAPLRCGCDPLGQGLIDAWREQDDETLMRAMLGLDELRQGTA